MSKRLLPLAAMEKILKLAGAKRVSDKAKVALKEIVEELLASALASVQQTGLESLTL